MLIIEGDVSFVFTSLICVPLVNYSLCIALICMIALLFSLTSFSISSDFKTLTRPHTLKPCNIKHMLTPDSHSRIKDADVAHLRRIAQRAAAKAEKAHTLLRQECAMNGHIYQQREPGGGFHCIAGNYGNNSEDDARCKFISPE